MRAMVAEACCQDQSDNSPRLHALVLHYLLSEQRLSNESDIQSHSHQTTIIWNIFPQLKDILQFMLHANADKYQLSQTTFSSKFKSINEECLKTNSSNSTTQKHENLIQISTTKNAEKSIFESSCQNQSKQSNFVQTALTIGGIHFKQDSK